MKCKPICQSFPARHAMNRKTAVLAAALLTVLSAALVEGAPAYGYYYVLLLLDALTLPFAAVAALAIVK